jgi:tetratricopeptide (TPR) repeat protein
MALVQRGAPQEAAAQFLEVLEMRPDDPDAHGDLGYALLAAGDLAEAAERLVQAIALAPDNLGVRLNLGSALFKLGRFEEAEAQYRHALALEPANTAAARNLGILLQNLGRTDEARALAESGGSQLRSMAASRRAEEAANLGRHAEALAALDELVALNPGDPEPIYRRAFARLLLRDYAGGWQDFAARWRIPRFIDESALISNPPITSYFDPELSAARLTGKRVLLVAEQGVGDQLMFASIIPDVLRIAASVALVCDDRLVRLFAASFPGVRVMGVQTAQPALGDFDKVVALGDLARLFRNGVEAFPGAPCLRAGPAARERWAAKLGPKSSALRVGISWRGGAVRTGAERRSVTLDELAPALDLPGCDVVSLQYGDVAEELDRFNAGRRTPIRAFPPEEIDDFEDLAALVQSLDVVVSVQTALVHLAGALGVPCLTLVAYRPEWVFTADGETLPWYRSVRLLRQPQAGDWRAPIAQAADLLKSPKSG